MLLMLSMLLPLLLLWRGVCVMGGVGVSGAAWCGLLSLL